VTTFLSLAIASALGVGYVPFAPGTFGSAVGLLLWAVLPPPTTSHGALIHGATIVILLVAGSFTGTVAERHFKRRDPRQVVLDEVMGMLITLFLIPVSWTGAIVGFLLFRAADVVKPYPANRLEALHGGFGVMADDAMAAVYANIALRLLVLASGGWLIG
jgi:phosphatidylglycerophosphatase A